MLSPLTPISTNHCDPSGQTSHEEEKPNGVVTFAFEIRSMSATSSTEKRFQEDPNVAVQMDVATQPWTLCSADGEWSSTVNRSVNELVNPVYFTESCKREGLMSIITEASRQEDVINHGNEPDAKTKIAMVVNAISPVQAEVKTKSKRRELHRAPDERGLTTKEVRRKRNREAMALVRQKQRENINKMKETLKLLEDHYLCLSDAARQRQFGFIIDGAGDDVDNSTNDSSSIKTLKAKYYQLADMSHMLQEEKYLLEKMLIRREKSYCRLRQAMIDREEELGLLNPLATQDDAYLFPEFEFTPITQEEASERIRVCYQQMCMLEETAEPLSAPGLSESTKGAKSDYLFSPASTFGWRISCKLSFANDVFICFAKFFPRVAPQEAMVRAWSTYTDTVKSMLTRRLIRCQVLQVINDSTFIAGMDYRHPMDPEKIMRGMHLRFRLQTEKGFAIGRSSMNPRTPELRALTEALSSIEYADSSSWIEFLHENDAKTGESGCLVKFHLRTEYNTQEDMYRRVVDTLARNLAWERSVMPSTLKVLPT